MNSDLLERLRTDPGRRTLGELLQEREAAAQEIARLRSRVGIATPSARAPVEGPRIAGELLRMADVCRALALSRSTIYKLLSEGAFPKPVRLGSRAVRWPRAAIEIWYQARNSTDLDTSGDHPG